MCLENSTPVMEDFPEEIITTKFLIALINDSVETIRSFSEKALERTAPMSGREDEVKFWQAAILLDGYVARDISLNDERVEFFLAHYDEDSGQYEYGFKNSYERYLEKKEWDAKQKAKNDNIEDS